MSKYIKNGFDCIEKICKNKTSWKDKRCRSCGQKCRFKDTKERLKMRDIKINQYDNNPDIKIKISNSLLGRSKPKRNKEYIENISKSQKERMKNTNNNSCYGKGLKYHKNSCQCNFCKSKRGEMKGQVVYLILMEELL